MSFVAQDDAKEQVRRAIDIVDLIGRELPLRRQGHNFVAHCPWHDDSRPSLQVNPQRQSWKCWVCDIGGDVFSFVMQRERVDFRQSLEMLAEQAGIVLRPTGPKTKPGDPNDKQTLYAASAWVAQQFAVFLQAAAEAEPARQYLAARGLGAASQQVYGLGYAPPSWSWLLDRARSSTFSPLVLEALGLVVNRDGGGYYDRFRGRVMFPITDAQGRVIAFGGRVLPELAKENDAKYVNSPETRLFSKSEIVYGLAQARDAIVKERRVVVVEGYTDVMMAHQAGAANVVAVLGTALGPAHIRLLQRYADTIVLALDGDEAGQRRTNEVLEMFVASEVDLRIFTLPDELDPCDFFRQRPLDDWNELVAGAHDAFEHAIRVRTRGIDPVRDTHRANQALEYLLAVLGKAPRLSSATNSARLLRERQVLARIAREFQVPETMLRQRLSDLRGSAPDRSAAALPAATPAGQERLPRLDPHETELFEILTQHPELIEAAVTEVRLEALATPTARLLFTAYRDLAERGETAEFQRVMSTLEDLRLKSLLVGLDEVAQAKESLAQLDAAARLRLLCDELRYRGTETERRRQAADLEKRRLSEADELALLQQLVVDERKRRGIPAPTDG